LNNTQKNLAAAFAGESQANRKYLAFAKQADAEKLPQVAKLFRAAAEAETIHAHTHLRNLGMIKSTAENLREAIAGETYEFTEMYPGFISEAQNENQSAAIVKGMQLANDAEKVHASLYQKRWIHWKIQCPSTITCAASAAISPKAPRLTSVRSAAQKLRRIKKSTKSNIMQPQKRQETNFNRFLPFFFALSGLSVRRCEAVGLRIGNKAVV
jgi:rubrerythrin